jgi:hypothetical protein
MLIDMLFTNHSEMVDPVPNVAMGEWRRFRTFGAVCSSNPIRVCIALTHELHGLPSLSDWNHPDGPAQGRSPLFLPCTAQIPRMFEPSPL